MTSETHERTDTQTSAADPAAKNPGWAPTHGVTDHAGRKLPNNLLFFAPPPLELGEVQTAWSELRVGEAIWTLWQRVGLYAVITAVVSFPVVLQVYTAAVAAQESAEEVRHRCVITAAGIGFLGLLALLTVKRPTITRTCTYVGQEGAAVFTMRAGRRPRQRALVLFTNIEALYYWEKTSSNHQFGAAGGLFGGAKFEYLFKDAAGSTLLRWKGRLSSDRDKSVPNAPYSVGAAIERAWTRYFLLRTAPGLESGGHVTFSAGSSEIRVGRGWLEVIRNGKTDRITPDELSDAKIVNGSFNLFVTGEAGLFGRRPRFTCPYVRVPNGKALFALLAGPFRNRAGPGMRPAA